jgi:hypothetical protein
VQFGSTAIIPNPLLTVAYLINLPHATKSGARLLASFGMGGYQTLLWSQLLRVLSDQLRKFISCKTNRLLIASFESPEELPPYPYLI